MTGMRAATTPGDDSSGELSVVGVLSHFSEAEGLTEQELISEVPQVSNTGSEVAEGHEVTELHEATEVSRLEGKTPEASRKSSCSALGARLAAFAGCSSGSSSDSARSTGIVRSERPSSELNVRLSSWANVRPRNVPNVDY